jgi:hypothetical protein
VIRAGSKLGSTGLPGAERKNTNNKLADASPLYELVYEEIIDSSN